MSIVINEAKNIDWYSKAGSPEWVLHISFPAKSQDVILANILVCLLSDMTDAEKKRRQASAWIPGISNTDGVRYESWVGIGV